MTDAVLIEIIKTAGIYGGILLTGVVTWKLNKVHKQINSRMDELLEMSKKSSKAEGVIEGATDNQAKTDAKDQKDK